jgi:hypothetical protein
MNLFKRHIGRRVAAVGVGVALLVLGLEGPAFAAAPVVSSFTPASGPSVGGCVIDVTGTSLDDFPAGASYVVEFVNTVGGAATAAADYAIISDTELWVAAPALTVGNEFKIRVTNPGGASTSTTSFLSTTGAGACAPTITSFLPTCGSAGATVTITGTNLLRDFPVGGVNTGTITGGIVSFSPYTSDAAQTVPDVSAPDTLGVLVSSDAADGPIKATTKGTTAAPLNGLSVFSSAKFEVPPPDCVPVGPVTHARSVSLSLRKHLVARGKVSSTEDPAFTDCVASVPVKIQRRVSGHWKTVGSTTTSDTGAYKKRIKDKAGKYRARATNITLNDGADICSRATSPVRRVT